MIDISCIYSYMHIYIYDNDISKPIPQNQEGLNNLIPQPMINYNRIGVDILYTGEVTAEMQGIETWSVFIV